MWNVFILNKIVVRNVDHLQLPQAADHFVQPLHGVVWEVQNLQRPDNSNRISLTSDVNPLTKK